MIFKLFVLFAVVIQQTYLLSVDQALKLDQTISEILHGPINRNVSRNLIGYINLFTGIMSYLIITLDEGKEEYNNSKFIYDKGIPEFLHCETDDLHLNFYQRKFQWTNMEREMFVYELEDSKTVWNEFVRTFELRNPDHIFNYTGDAIHSTEVM